MDGASLSCACRQKNYVSAVPHTADPTIQVPGADSNTVLHSLPEQVLNMIQLTQDGVLHCAWIKAETSLLLIICEVKLGWTCMEANHDEYLLPAWENFFMF
jgi:hypothetical protein